MTRGERLHGVIDPLLAHLLQPQAQGHLELDVPDSVKSACLPAPAYPPFSVQLSLAQSGLHVSMKWGLGVEARVFRARLTRMLAVQATQYLGQLWSQLLQIPTSGRPPL